RDRMPLLLLLLLYLACLTTSWPEPPFGWAEAEQGVRWSSLLSLAVMSLVVVGAAWISRRARRRLLFDPSRRETILRSYSRARFLHLLSLFFFFGVALYACGWGWAVHQFCALPVDEQTRWLLPGAEFVVLSPIVLALVLSWCLFYDAERAFHDTAHPLLNLRPYWSRRDYVGFHLRQYLALVFVPVFLVVVMLGTIRTWPGVFESGWMQYSAPLLLVVMIAFLPWILRLVLGLRSLPNGEMRRRLEAVAARLRFRCSDIMLWNTHNGVANALVVGIVPWLRYVVLSDRLLEELTPDEVEAVFGHEAGHVKHQHMPYYLTFFILSMAVLVGGLQLVWPEKADGENYLQMPFFLGSLGAYIFLVFGFLSRRCERQADLYGCRAVSCGRPDCSGHDEGTVPTTGRDLCPTGIQIFIQALERVAILNGISRSRPGFLQSWQHSTIDRRVRFLEEVAADPTVERRFQRRVGLVKWALLLGLILLLGMVHLAVPQGLADSRDKQTNSPIAAPAAE
ncbi:MAG: M48 family metalloprotease, partial [Planctomycetia bacterium]|nr:M48 family metalloprotease [Planctomycetia bacterium]